MTNQKYRPAKFGTVLLSKDGEEFFNSNGVLCIAGTCDPMMEDYPHWTAARACSIADNAILKALHSTSKSDRSK